MTGSGQTCPRQSSSTSAIITAHLGPQPLDHAGQRRQERVDLGLGRLAGQRDPDVAVGERAHRRQHVAGLERGRRARRAARHAEAQLVELGRPATRRRRRGTRTSPGAAAGRRGRRPRRCPRWSRRRARIRSTRACWRALTSPRSATTACSAAAAASAAGTFSKPGTRSSIRSSTGNGCRHRAPLRTSSTPTPAGPPHLCAEAAAALHPSGSGSRPGRGAGVGEHGYAAGDGGQLADGLGGADLVVGGLDGQHAGAGRRRSDRDAAQAVDRQLRGAAGPGAGVQHRGVLDSGVGDPPARAGAPVQARAARDGPPRCPRR